IKRYLGEFFTLARSIKKASETTRGEVSLVRNFQQLAEMGKHGALDANDQHVVHIVDWLWQYAFEQRASDIHIEPRRDAGTVRFRIDGVLHQVYAIPNPVLVAMTSRIKLLARMEIVEKRRPQDGRIKTVAPDGQEIELRISTMQPAIGVDFASGVRTLLRQDPDIIMVGEIRDRDTADMAVQAALTGHLVLSTLHTNDAPTAITRLLDLGVPPYLINSTVLGVMAQRLVRTLCPHCKKPAD